MLEPGRHHLGRKGRRALGDSLAFAFVVATVRTGLDCTEPMSSLATCSLLIVQNLMLLVAALISSLDLIQTSSGCADRIWEVTGFD